MTLSEFAQRFVFVNEALIRGGLAVEHTGHRLVADAHFSPYNYPHSREQYKPSLPSSDCQGPFLFLQPVIPGAASDEA